MLSNNQTTLMNKAIIPFILIIAIVIIFLVFNYVNTTYYSLAATTNLESQVYLQEDFTLDSRYSVQTIPSSPIEQLFGRPGIINSYTRLVQEGNRVVGHIYVDVYRSKRAADQEFWREQDVLKPLFVAGEYTFKEIDLGEKEAIVVSPEGDTTFISFTRCSALVKINLPLTTEENIAYSRLVDERLISTICTSSLQEPLFILN
jgi:hypothetical protein